MSTEEKKAAKNAEALSHAEMSGVVGGKSHSGKEGGGLDFADAAGRTDIAALSDSEMSGVAGGRSHSGTDGGGLNFVDNEATAEIKLL